MVLPELLLGSGKEFQKELFLQTPQFYYMGLLDDKDAVPNEDAFSQNERDLIYLLLGREILPRRWEQCKVIYLNEGVNARIITFEYLGHEHPEFVKQEIVAFFKTQLRKATPVIR